MKYRFLKQGEKVVTGDEFLVSPRLSQYEPIGEIGEIIVSKVVEKNRMFRRPVEEPQETLIKNEAEKPFVHLTISGKQNSDFFSLKTGIAVNYTNGEEYDYHDIDLERDLPNVIRVLGQMDANSYCFTTEESED